MQPTSAQLKPGLPKIGNDPISKALAWLRTQGGNAQNFITGAANTVVNDSGLGKIAQGKFNEVLPAVKKNIEDNFDPKLDPNKKLWEQPEAIEKLNKVSFVGDMVEVPTPPKVIAKPGLPDIPQRNTQILDKYGNPMKSAEPVELGTGTHLIKNAQGDYVPNPNPKPPVYSQNTPEYPKSFTAEQRTKGINYSEPEPKTSPAMKNPPAERTYSPSTATKEDVITNQKRNIQIDGKDIKTPKEVEQVNATLNGHGVKGSMTEQLQLSNDKIGSLSNQAKTIVEAQGGGVSKGKLINQTMQKLSYGSGPDTSTEQMTMDAKNYINDLYVRATGQDVTKGVAAPENIPGTILQDMKTLANADAKSTFEQLDPTKWNIRQRVSRYGRDAIDTMLDTEYPAASKLNNDMSDLYRAQDSLRKGANAEGVTMQKNANAPQPNIFEKIEGALKKHPMGALALGAAGTIGIPPLIKGGIQLGSAVAGHLPDIGDSIASTLGYYPKSMANDEKSNEQVSHDGSITPKYSSSTPLDDGSVMSESQYAQSQQALQAKMGGEKLSDPQAYNEDMARYQQNETQFNSQQGIRTVANNTKTVVNTANLAYPAIASANPSMMNALVKGFDEFSKADNGKYAQLSTYLQQLSQLSGVDLSTAKSKDALMSAIDGIVKAQNAKLDTAKTQYFGTTNTEQQNTISNYTPPAPQAPPPPANANSIVGGSLPSLNLPSLNLPNIPQ